MLDELEEFEGIQLIPFSAIDGSGLDDIKEAIGDESTADSILGRIKALEDAE